MTSDQFISDLDTLTSELQSKVKSESEFKAALGELLDQLTTPALDEMKQLALLVKKVRITQNAYFDSRTKGRFGDKAILAESKRLEKELDQLADALLNQF